MSEQVMGSVSYSNNSNFAAGDPFQWQQNSDHSNGFFHWPPPGQQPSEYIYPISTGITIPTGDIEIAYEGQLRLNEETGMIERFNNGIWEEYGKPMEEMPDIHIEEDDDFELGGAL